MNQEIFTQICYFLIVYFLSELFTNRKRYLKHCVINVPPATSKNDLEGVVKNLFVGSRVDIQPYDELKAGIFYIAKNGLAGEDWDILGGGMK